MANSRSAKKRIRQNQTRRLANKSYRSMVRTTVKTFEGLLKDADKVTAGEKFIKVQKVLDTAARKGHVHKNTVARKLSRLSKRLAAVKA